MTRWWMSLGLVLAVAAGAYGQDVASREVATLGVETRDPTAGEIARLELPRHVRTLGQVIAAVTTHSAAYKAGIRAGDVLVSLDANSIYSRDDVVDFLSVARPRQQVVATVRRAARQDTPLRVTLGSKSVPDRAGFRWQFVGRPQLARALKAAHSQKRWVLVGLSGSDT